MSQEAKLPAFAADAPAVAGSHHLPEFAPDAFVTAVSFLVFSTVMGEEINAPLRSSLHRLQHHHPSTILPFVINAAIDVLTVNKRLSRSMRPAERQSHSTTTATTVRATNPSFMTATTQALEPPRGGLAVEMANALRGQRSP